MENKSEARLIVLSSSNFAKNLDFVRHSVRSGKSVVICANALASRERLVNVLHNSGLKSEVVNNIADVKVGCVSVADIFIEDPFEWRNLVFVPSRSLVSRSHIIKRTPDNAKKKLFVELNKIDLNQYVVHKDYGVGIFEGTKTFDLGGQQNECLKIRYADGTLYVPVSKINLVTKHDIQIVADDLQILDYLGSASWSKARKKAENQVAELAQKIISTASKRKMFSAKKYDITERQGLLDEFCQSFPYSETQGQLDALNDVYNDLESGFGMDRLICGDVGFGKTEVALRAIFVVTCGKKLELNYSQVAFICPTIFLARQNCKLMQKRFQPLGINVSLLSGSMVQKEKDRVRHGIADGSIDVLVGTHAVLAKDVKFADLGLIVYDEEQSFGVEQKESLKSKHPKAHFLSLSATPIPRTLNKALSGLQEISTITMPPKHRIEIKTEIIKFSIERVREIIEKEKSLHGQTIVITPRIADIEELVECFSLIVPREKILILHGRQDRAELAEKQEMMGGKDFELVIATTIIAYGMDFDVNNTIFINKPEMFGLAQLHQIRGRVGRRAEQAYCYLLVDDRTLSDKVKMVRLNTLKNLSHFGAGFEIANMDLDQRGEGSLLGREQSGKSSAISSNLYYELLNEAINHLSHNLNIDRLSVPNVELDLPIYISTDYISSVRSRMDCYRKIGDMVDLDELNAFVSGVKDVFGSKGFEIKNLEETVMIRSLCKRHGISSVVKKGDGVIVSFYFGVKIDVGTLMELVAKDKRIKVLPNNTVFLQMKKSESIFDSVCQSIEDFVPKILETKPVVG